MAVLLSLLFSIASMSMRPLPVGTQLHIRLANAVGSYASRPGSPIEAVLIAPVAVDGETILPAGSTLSGAVKTVTRVGFGVRHETAGLDLEFSKITPPGGETVPLSAQLTAVDNGRERVNRNGRIQGVRSTSSMCYRVSGYIHTVLLWEVHAELAAWAIRSLLMQLPEPEIYYPAGVELTLALTEPLLVDAPVSSSGLSDLRLIDDPDLSPVVAAIPYRTRAPNSGRPSDLTNVMFLGSRDQIVAAFDAAGWTQANPSSLRRRIDWIRAAGELKGDDAAPMSPLLLDGAEPDMSWEKGLNDVSKRHHIRVWRQPDTWRGNEIWIGAATRDIDFAYLRHGAKLTHRIEENIDDERDKVAYDLAFTSCGQLLDWMDRPDFPRSTRNATGDPMTTDGRMVVIGLNDCRAPRLASETLDLAPLPRHGSKMQRFARREILSARNEVIRTNPVWRSYEAGRWIVEYLRHRNQRIAIAQLSSR